MRAIGNKMMKSRQIKKDLKIEGWNNHTFSTENSHGFF